MTFIRNDQADIRVSVNGTPFGDSWKEAEGGSLEVSSDTKVRGGGMGTETSVGGLPTRSDLTIRTNMTDVAASWIAPLEAVVGSGRAVVSLIWLNPDASRMGIAPTVRRGTVKSVNIPNMGADSAMAMFELVISCDQAAG